MREPDIIKVTATEAGMTLLDLIAARRNISKKAAKRLLDTHNVLVNKHRLWIAKHRIEKADIIELPLLHKKTDIRTCRIEIVFENKDLVAITKPAGILANKDKNSAEQYLQKVLKNPELTAIHRLDRQTSGILLFAKNSQFKESMIEVFRKGNIQKEYHAIVSGSLVVKRKEISHPLDGKRAESIINTIDVKKNATHVAVTILTGRTHQIRKHLALTGHPVIGDTVYQLDPPDYVSALKVQRHMLHAYRISFSNPTTNQTLSLRSELPDDFKTCLKKLRMKA